MAEPRRRPAAWADLLATPEDVKAEVLAGELWMSPRPAPIHSGIQFNLSGELYGFGGQRGGSDGWWFLIEPDVRLGPHDIVSPDLVGWRKSRVPNFPLERPIEIVPDWVCEVLSPSNASRDRTRKADLYLRTGVPFYWLIDPEARTLEALAAEAGRWVRLGAWADGDIARVAPFEARELEIGVLFPPVATSEA